MKRTIILIALCFILCFCFSSVAYAKETESEQEFSIYIKEKIVPVVVGVLTAVIALLTTLGSISKSLNSLKDTKDIFSKEACDRQEYSKALKKEVEQLTQVVKNVPELEGKIDNLMRECETIAEILSLGFSSNKEIIKSGKGRQMSLLLEKCEVKRDEKN